MTGSCNINVFKIDLKKLNIEIYLIKKSNKQGSKFCLVYNLNKKKKVVQTVTWKHFIWLNLSIFTWKFWTIKNVLRGASIYGRIKTFYDINFLYIKSILNFGILFSVWLIKNLMQAIFAEQMEKLNCNYTIWKLTCMSIFWVHSLKNVYN